MASTNPGVCQACKGDAQGTEELMCDADKDMWLCRECADMIIDTKKLEERYLVWHDTKFGFSCFGLAVWHSARSAEDDARLFRADGLDARVVGLRVVDGYPVASWVNFDMQGREVTK